MGLSARWLVSFALLVLPVAITLGILFGVQWRYEAQGNTGYFGGSPDDGGPKRLDNSIVFERNCDIAYGLGNDQRWKGQEYQLNPNQWGLQKGQESNLCMDVLWHNNGSYATKTTAPKFQVTWQYPPGPPTAPVHAYPNVKVENVFPKKIADLTGLNLNVEWTYALGNENKTKSDIDETATSDVNANVAVDLFIDSDENTSKDSTKATMEIMVWFAAIGGAAKPVGNERATPVHTMTVDGNDFELFVGTNSGTKQNVFSWVATKAVENFNDDIYPMIDYVIKNPLPTGAAGPTTVAQWPKGSDYIGYMGMGTEAYNAPKNVTFYVPLYEVDVKSS